MLMVAANAENEYGIGFMKQAAAYLGIPVRTLYDYVKVATEFPDRDFVAKTTSTRLPNGRFMTTEHLVAAGGDLRAQGTQASPERHSRKGP